MGDGILMGVEGEVEVTGLLATVDRLPIEPHPNREEAGEGGGSSIGEKLEVLLFAKQLVPIPAAYVRDWFELNKCLHLTRPPSTSAPGISG